MFLLALPVLPLMLLFLLNCCVIHNVPAAPSATTVVAAFDERKDSPAFLFASLLLPFLWMLMVLLLFLWLPFTQVLRSTGAGGWSAPSTSTSHRCREAPAHLHPRLRLTFMKVDRKLLSSCCLVLTLSSTPARYAGML